MPKNLDFNQKTETIHESSRKGERVRDRERQYNRPQYPNHLCERCECYLNFEVNSKPHKPERILTIKTNHSSRSRTSLIFTIFSTFVWNFQPNKTWDTINHMHFRNNVLSDLIFGLRPKWRVCVFFRFHYLLHERWPKTAKTRRSSNSTNRTRNQCEQKITWSSFLIQIHSRQTHPLYPIPNENDKINESNSLAHSTSHWCLVTSVELDPHADDTMR